MNESRLALVLGATGGIGGAIAQALIERGWRVRGMARNLAHAQAHGNPHIEWVQGDAMQRAAVMAAACGASAIVHAVNPPGYRNWDTQVLPMIDNTIAAALAAGGARIILPGTVYNYDPSRTCMVKAHTLQQPRSRKGRIRVELERRLREAAPAVPTLVLRAGDFFGPGTRSSWFSQAMVKPGQPLRRIINPAAAGHSWAYLPDLARTFAELMDLQESLQPFECLQFAGHHDATGTQLAEAVQRVAGRPLARWKFPWWLMRALAPLGGFAREAAEIAPYWKHPIRLDNQRLLKLIGTEPHTALDDAIRATLASLAIPTR